MMTSTPMKNSGFSLVEMAISMSIASIMVLGTVTLALDGAQSQWTASRLSSMTTTASDIINSLQRDALQASSATATATSITFTMANGPARAYTLDANQNLTLNGNALNSQEQQLVCAGTCFTVTDVTSGANTIGQLVTVQNLRVESRADNRTAMENKMNRSARYTLPTSSFSISGQDAFL